ncbi:MAG: Bacteriophage replication protein [Bryobacterales bacterium]|nr:Bacteriophage replication protein [Bryobacterales bacterium]
MTDFKHECTSRAATGSTSFSCINDLHTNPSEHQDKPRELAYTKQPNALVDYWMPRLVGSEFLVVIYLARLTFGFHRRCVEVGRRSIAKRTGLHVETVQTAVVSLARRRLISCHPSASGRTIFEFNVDVLCNECTENPNTEPAENMANGCTENPNAECTENPNDMGHCGSECSETSVKTVRKSRTRERNSEKKRSPASQTATRSQSLDSAREVHSNDPKADAALFACQGDRESEFIGTVLEENAVRTLKPEVIPELVSLAASHGINVAGLAAFIRWKCKSRPVELAEFFRKAIPEDMPGWARRFGRYYQATQSSPKAEPQEATGDALISCAETRWETGAAVRPDEACLVQVAEGEVQYFAGSIACAQCLSTLRVSREQLGKASVSKCAFCDDAKIRSGLRERLTDVAAALNAASPAQKCESCEWDHVAGRNTGLIKSDWMTERSSASYCECRWGEHARSLHPSGHIEQISRTEREIARREREWSAAPKQPLLRCLASPPPIFSSLPPTPEPGARPRCPECGMDPGRGFRVAESRGARVMMPCICTEPELAAEMRKAADRSQKSRLLRQGESMLPISAAVQAGSVVLARAVA